MVLVRIGWKRIRVVNPKIIFRGLTSALVMAWIFTGCRSPKPLSELPYSAASFPDTLGVFSNYSVGVNWQPASLWSRLYFKNEADTLNWRLKEVRLIQVSETKIQAELMLDDVVQDCAVFNGKLETTCFNLQRQHRFDPFIVIIAIYSVNDSRIAFDENSNLICENSRQALALAGCVLPVFGAGGAPTITIYEKKE